MKEALLVVIGALIAALLAVTVYQNHRRFHKPLLTTPYQSVVLVNGEVFYGRLDHLGSDHPVLRNAFTIRREPDPGTGQPRYTLIRRADEADGADHIIIPASAIAYAAPVLADSTVGRLIGQAGLR